MLEFSESHAFIDYVNELRSPGGVDKYKKACTVINPRTDQPYIDGDDDFLVGDSGGFLCNRSFKFVNVDEFNEVARFYDKHNCYTLEEEGTAEYNAFVRKEEDRRENGMTAMCKVTPEGVIEELRITGEMYNMINYGRMELADLNSLQSNSITAKMKIGFPRFFESHYWRTKINEFCLNNGLNLLSGKTRRAGWSYGEAMDTANKSNLINNYVTVLAAYDTNYITTKEGAICPMIRDQLLFYEQHTPFCRGGKDTNGDAIGLLSKKIENMRVGFKDKQNNDDGVLSSILAVPYANNPDVARGKGANDIKLEEMSKAQGIFLFLDATLAVTKVGGFTRGHIRAWGTAGSKEGDWESFEAWFNDPSKYNAMVFENVWDEDARTETCGYFKSRLECFEGFHNGVFCMDKDGNSNLELTWKAIQKDLINVYESNLHDKERYINYRAENATCPSEAFSVSFENIFSSHELNDHIKNVKYNNDLHFHRDGILVRNAEGKLIFKENIRLQNENLGKPKEERYPIHEYINEYPLLAKRDLHGCIREWFPPYRDATGNIPKNLYSIALDPFAFDINKKDLKQYHSLASIRVKINNNNVVYGQSNRVVATYCGRPDTTLAVSKIAMELAEYYNAEVMAEVDRGTTVADFKVAKKLHMLASEPISVWDSKASGESSKYGIVIGAGKRRLDGLDYVKEDLYEVRGVDENGVAILNLHYELDLPYLLELQKFNGIRNADRISTAIVGAYHVKDCTIKHKRIKTTKRKEINIFDHMDMWYGGTGKVKTCITDLM